MELVTLTHLLVWLTILTLLLFLLRRKKKTGDQRLPPGPPGWPIIGNIFDIGTLPHRTLNQLRDKYGGVIWLRFGSINSMAIVSAKAATELFKNHDLSFADRYINEAMRAHGFHESSLLLAPHGTYWRALRRLVTTEMMASKRVKETASMRRKCVDNMVKWIEKEAERLKRGNNNNKQCCGIRVAHFVELTLFNVIGNLDMSRDLVDQKSEMGAEFFEAIEGLAKWVGSGNLADFFPWTKRFDPQGLRRKMERDLGRALEIASTFVKERREEQPEVGRRGGGLRRGKDLLDMVLEFKAGEMGNRLSYRTRISTYLYW